LSVFVAALRWTLSLARSADFVLAIFSFTATLWMFFPANKMFVGNGCQLRLAAMKRMGGRQC
jgi:hypothetical protein